ncbi:phage tail assembly chaperone [Paenirhodobacter enshiensis]|uniref:phage tail assembly chaperone n=1 Tax=Paenirhodobacter enshiensis TaxID=1105367 RepID=UPI0009DF7F4D|nr:phage tail assembly chaperone [Paenirhodobacter enshiensis]
MTTWVIHTTEGEIVGSFTGTEGDLALNLPDGHVATEGQGSGRTHYVEAGAILEKPPRPSLLYAWDAASKAWAISDTATALAFAELRAERSRRLAACDWTQARDSPLSDADLAAWAAYRAALRDLPSTATDPTAVVWPEPPNTI